MANKVVARYADGRIVKGTTSDFVPTKDRFHVAPTDAAVGARAVEIQMKELKAVFFVKDLVGNPGHEERQDFDATHPMTGRRVRVTFADGEVLVGTTQAYQPGRPGLFMVPADAESNIDRCYVVGTSTREIALI